MVLLTASVELADRDLVLIDDRARHEANDAAGATADDSYQWLVERARRLLLPDLLSSAPVVRRWLTWIRPRRSASWPAIMFGLAVGLASNAMGPSRAINILSMPLLVAIFWNVSVLSASVGAHWLPAARTTLPTRLRAWFMRTLDRWLSRAPEISFGGNTEASVWRRALASFTQLWSLAIAPLSIARIRRTLHFAALALIVGMIVGMYVRGIALSYRATWESTFLGPESVGWFLDRILTPASKVLDLPVPAAAGIESPATGDAAPWIHLFAVTATLFVALPRAIFALIETQRINRLEKAVTIAVPRSYLRRLQAAISRSQTVVELLPYSYLASDRAMTRLKTLLLDLFGASVEVRTLPRLSYGADGYSQDPRQPAGESETVVALFGLAQTPETEVHGEWLRSLTSSKDLLVVVDASKYRSTASEERVKERRRAWSRVVKDSGLIAVHLDLEKAGCRDESLERLAERRDQIERRK